MKICAIRIEHKNNKTYISTWRKDTIRKEYIPNKNSLDRLCNYLFNKELMPYINATTDYVMVTYYTRNVR